MWSDACIVELRRSGQDDPKPSCSALILDAHQGLVLTHASILWPLLDPDQRSRLLNKGHLVGEALSQYAATIVLECVNDISDDSDLIRFTDSNNTNNYNNRMLLQARKCGQCYDNIEPGARRFKQLSGTVRCVWRSEPFDEIVQSMLRPSDGWKFTDDGNTGAVNNDDNNSETQTPIIDAPSRRQSNAMDSNDVFTTLPFFLLIELSGGGLIPRSQSALRVGAPVRQGGRLVIVGTPFGCLSPSVFINSVSEGVLCNAAGNQRELLLTDARAIPGTEGGPMYGVDGGVVGLVVASLCWKSTEWIGLSIGCTLHAALTSLPYNMVDIRINKVLQHLSTYSSVAGSTPGGATPCVSAVLRQVALVRCGGCWGSALVLDAHQGVLLTCGHVVKNRQGETVSVLRTCPRREGRRARVVYTSRPGEPYDVAILRLHEPWSNPGEDANRPTVRAPQTGEAVFTVGHACFSEQHNLQPSVTRGIVSKVIHKDKMAVILQSTCAVHAGSSGGPLVASNGDILGLLTCNVKDVVSGSSYPHVNMSVPLIKIWPIIEQYLLTNDATVLHGLRVGDATVKALWAIEGNLPQLPSKL